MKIMIVSPFNGYEVGEMVTDMTKIEEATKSNPHDFVKLTTTETPASSSLAKTDTNTPV